MIKFLKIIPTESDLIAEVEEDEEFFILNNPVQLGLDNQQRPILIPWSPLTEGEIRIHKDHVLYICGVREEISNSYSMMFSGIVTAKPDEVNKINKKNRLII